MKINIEKRELIIKYRKNKYQKDIYDRICENTMGINLNEIYIKYEIKKEDNKLRIFGDVFIEYNNNNCKIILNGKVYDLVSHLNIKKMKKNNKLIEIKLRGIKNIIFANEMLFECSSLKSLSDISKWNTNNVTDLYGCFFNCYHIREFPDISNGILKMSQI